MVTVRFYGSLKTFGSEFQLDVKDTAEALKALFSQLPNLRQTMQQGFYKVRIGRQYLDNRYLEQGLFYRLKPGMTIHITPVVAGAKKAGVFNLVVGAILVAASWYAGGAAGWGYLGASGYGMATMGTMMGVSMMLSGVSMMLTKTPSMGGIGSDSDKKQSSGFGNIQNIAAQGQPVPLAYGRIRCGAMIISQGVETYDAESEKDKQDKPIGFTKG
ncbi:MULTISPECIES: tail assembly protein [Glaesserella]|uniref:Phage tail protein n=1 Tax=Glaesserella australis TaxID=2094024 RepID=A0A328C1Z2_9PAST|nr:MULTISPECIES: tail assembly protein [Glaesserella]AUI65633.1 phage tail protein [Glaesserella sp. 15-184]RAL19080.1 phage tail protein [Glaesserella australis]